MGGVGGGAGGGGIQVWRGRDDKGGLELVRDGIYILSFAPTLPYPPLFVV